eukprot:s2614_g7.t1
MSEWVKSAEMIELPEPRLSELPTPSPRTQAIQMVQDKVKIKLAPTVEPVEAAVQTPAVLRQEAEESVRPDDSASAVGSAASWSVVHDGQQGGSVQGHAQGQVPVPKPPPPGFAPSGPAFDSVPEKPAQADTDSDEGPPQDWTGGPGQQSHFPAAAPATQAARQVLGSAQKQAEKLASQKARAKKRGGGRGENERSVLIIDSRDKRIQSPFQNWLLDEILLNAQSGVNILSDRQLIRSPNSGYHMNLFYVRTIDGYKLILIGSMTSYGTVPCARWDKETGEVMKHQAFQPFRWPMMTNESSTWVDVKLKVEGDLLLHLELRGYRSDDDMTVQMNYLNDEMVSQLDTYLFVPSCVVTIFQGWRVIATSFEVGGRLYACSDGGVVVAMDFPLCHFEIRLTATSSADSIGMDADRLEFRFRSSGDRLDVACSQVVVPSTWLVVSRVSGPTLIKNARWCRENHARIEGPDQTMQLSQLAGVHAHWTASIEATSIEEVGPRIGAVDVGTHPGNLHLTCESPLFKAEQKIVPKDALALQFHDVEAEQLTTVLPPVTGGPSVVPASSTSGLLRALAGPSSQSITVAPKAQGQVSLNEPGQASEAMVQAGGTVHAQRRSLEVRRAEMMSNASVTPQAFLDRVDQATSGYQPAPRGAPRSYGPQPVVEEVTDC